jgi:O-antigen biosynthesis protein
MTMVPFQLVPHAGLSGSETHWMQTGTEGWFRLVVARPAQGRWLRIIWQSGYQDPVTRPVLRSHAPGRPDIDFFLPGSPFGRQSWVGLIPPDTVEILLSFSGEPGPFHVRIERIELFSGASALRKAARRVPGQALHALAAGSIGRLRDMDILLREALGQFPLAQYGAWRAARHRLPDIQGIDGPAPEGPHIRLVVSAHAMAGQQIEKLHAVAESQPYPRWSLMGPVAISEAALPDAIFSDLHPDDLVLSLPAGAALLPHTLLAVAAMANRHAAAQVFYGDEECLGEGTRLEPVLRPAFDPVLAECRRVVPDLAFWRVRAWRDARGQRPSEAGLTAETAIALNRVLARRERREPSPAAAVPAFQPDPVALDRIEATIIIPTRDRLELLRPCIESLRTRTAGPFRLIVADNDSTKPETIAFLRALAEAPDSAVIAVPGPFNFSRLCNAAARQSGSQVLVFLNNDTLVIEPDWLRHLKAFALRPDVGAVGAKLLYPDGTVQHAGVVAGLGGRAGHFEIGGPADEPGFFGRAPFPHTLSAVTGACLAVEKRKFDNCGGFEEEHLPVDLNDIDLCLRLMEAGYRNVLVPQALLYHLESASRGRGRDNDRRYARERAYFSGRWLSRLRHDPHFHPVLSLYASRPRLG